MGLDNSTAQPDATTQPEQTDANRTAGAPLDAGTGMTQAQIDAIVQSRLAEERRRIQSKYGDLDELAKAKQILAEREEADLTELQKLQKQLDDAKAREDALKQEAEAARLDTLRMRIGQEVGLPPVLSARLQGADEDTIRADAEAVKAVLGGDQPANVPNLDATAGGGAQTRTSTKLTPEERAAADRAGIPYDVYAQARDEANAKSAS